VVINLSEGTLSRQFGTPTPSELEKINALAKRPLSKEEVFVFGAKLVGDMLIPNRYIQIHKSLLQVFKQDAQNGIAFMLDHPWAGFFTRPKPALVYGRTFDAVLKKSQGVEGEAWALYADHYIVRGKEKDGISTDSIIADIEDGTLFDTSIGWGADNYECSICGNDIRNYLKCEHWPGKTYEVDGEQLLCYIIAKPPGFLMENSGVFAGAYPTAGMLSQVSDEVQKEGYIEVVDLKQAPLDAKLFHVYSANKGSLATFMRQNNSPDKKLLAFSAASENSLKGDKGMSGNANENDLKTYTQEEVDTLVKEAVEKEQAAYKEALAAVQSASGGTAQPAADPPKVFMTQEQANTTLGKEYSAETILTFAKEGIDHHAEVVDEALAWGVRAQGNDFPAETWKSTFSTMGTKAIKDIMATFKSQAEQGIPAGRQSEAGAGKEKLEKKPVPDEAYKA
jgi:hypothetical protein